MKIKMAIFDGDFCYTNKFFDAVNTSLNEKIELHAFTSEDSLWSFLKENKVEVLLLGESVFFIEKIIKDILTIKLVENMEIKNDTKVIFKYQNVNLIYKEIMNIYSNYFRIDKSNVQLNITEIISYMSSGNGSGASTISSAHAINLANAGNKVLFIDLQMFSTVDAVFSAEGKYTIGEVFYALKNQKIDLVSRLESVVRQDESGVFFWQTSKNPAEITEITKDDLERLIVTLKNSSEFDFVIIDCNFLYNEITQALIQNCNKIFIVLNSTIENKIKLKSILSIIEMYSEQVEENLVEKICFVYNKYIKGKDIVKNDLNFKVAAIIPHINDENILLVTKKIANHEDVFKEVNNHLNRVN